jgi:hypothetical protein
MCGAYNILIGKPKRWNHLGAQGVDGIIIQGY